MAIPTKTQIHHIVDVRAKTLRKIREFFDNAGFLEIDAPILIKGNAVEAFIDPLTTAIHHPQTEKRTELFLHTSPEIHMKRLLSRGIERIYFLGHVFRDRELSIRHLNEFLMLEWYETGSDLEQMIERCEALFRILAKECAKNPLYASNVDFGSGFERLSMNNAWKKFAQIDLLKCLGEIADGDQAALTKAVQAAGEHVRADATFEDVFTHVMLKYIEPSIGRQRPCLLYDWPNQTSALARLHPENHLLAQRFEIYCDGTELANAFVELTDSKEQRKRFLKDNQKRIDRGQSPLPINEEFLTDLEKMPPSCGIAVGIDRLIALFLRAKSISEVTHFLP